MTRSGFILLCFAASGLSGLSCEVGRSHQKFRAAVKVRVRMGRSLTVKLNLMNMQKDYTVYQSSLLNCFDLPLR